MSARDQLRRFLEQRRELGETELVLDELTVDEVMAIVDARQLHGSKESARPDAPAPRPSTQTPRAETSAPRAETRTPPPEGRMPRGVMGMPLQPASPASDQPSDWREALRASGAAPDDAPDPAGAELAARRAGSGVTPPSTPGDALGPAGLVVGTTSRELFGGVAAHLNTIEEIARAVASCTRCPLYATAKNPVPGSGSDRAEFMVVGEAPGATEDEQGLPFVGAAGQLLTKILEAIDLRRDEVFICNVLKHRPPGNRNPLPDEVTACSPYLIRQIELIRPKVLLALGTFAAQTLLETKLSIGKLRGQIHRYYGVPLIVTYHPAALLRNPSWKRPTWEDVQLARRILDRARAGA